MFGAMVAAIFAGIGGLLPSIARLAAAFATQPDQPLPHPHILIGLALFFVIGAVLSVAFNRDSDIGRGVIIGISAPGIITNILAGATQGTTSPPPIPPGIFAPAPRASLHDSLSLLSSAWAQDVGQSTGKDTFPSPNSNTFPSPNLQPKPKSIVLNTVSIGPPSSATTVSVGWEKNDAFHLIAVYTPGQNAVIEVPADADTLVLQSGQFRKNLDLWKNPGSPFSYAVTARLINSPTPSGDLLWSLGAHRPTSLVGLDAIVTPILSPNAPVTVDTRISTKAKLQETIAQLQRGDPNFSQMEPALQLAVKQQLPLVRARLASLGPLQSLAFSGQQNGADVYDARFAEGSTVWTIQLAPNGKIATLWFQ